MCHIEQGTRCISLDTEIFGAGQSGKGDESPGLCDLGLIVIYDQSNERESQTRKASIVPYVARFVTHPTALHWTSTFGLSICRIRGSRPPRFTMRSLLSATETLEISQSATVGKGHTINSQIPKGGAGCSLNLGVMAA